MNRTPHTLFPNTFAQVAAGLAVLSLAGHSAVQAASPEFALSAAPETPAAPPQATLAQPYRLVVADQLDITVQGHDELKRTVQVLADGTFAFPIVGTVPAVGKTPGEVEALLTKGLSGIVNQPVVSVAVTASHVAKVTILGGAKLPGQPSNGVIDFRPGMRVLDALGASGGLVNPPEQTLATLVTAGGQQSRPIDLIALMSGRDITQNVPLAPGDILLLQQRDPSTYSVQVLGDVTKPGAFPVTPQGATVVALLTLAGGPTATAALTGAQILHAGQAKTVNLHTLVSNLNDPSGAINLTAGDTLLIPDNRAKVAVLGEVKTPNVYLIPDGEPLTISLALAEAGGFTDLSNKKQIEILRPDAQGERQVIALNIDNISKDDTGAADTLMQPGDILYVPTRRKGHSVFDGLGSASALALGLRGL